MNKKLLIILGVIVVLVLCGVGIYGLTHPKSVAGAIIGNDQISGTTGNALTGFNGIFVGSDGLSQAQTGSTVSLTTTVFAGTCNTGTSTLFSIANPFTATSTVTNVVISGLNGATTTDIAIGTTSASSAPTATFAVLSMNNFMFLSGVPANQNFYASSGNKTMNTYMSTSTSGTGVTIVQNTETIIGSGQFISAYSTSTVATGGNGSLSSGFMGIPTSCTYKVEIQS